MRTGAQLGLPKVPVYLSPLLFVALMWAFPSYYFSSQVRHRGLKKELLLCVSNYSVGVIKYSEQTNLKRKIYFASTFTRDNVYNDKEGTEVGAGNDWSQGISTQDAENTQIGETLKQSPPSVMYFLQQDATS